MRKYSLASNTKIITYFFALFAYIFLPIFRAIIKASKKYEFFLYIIHFYQRKTWRGKRIGVGKNGILMNGTTLNIGVKIIISISETQIYNNLMNQ